MTYPYYKSLKLLLVAVFFISFQRSYAQDKVPTPGKQVKARLASYVNEKDLNYFVYLPENYKKAANKNPLLIFLHGIDQVGKDLDLVLKYGPPKLANEGKQFPMVIISLQQSHFVGKKYAPRFNSDLIHELIIHAIKAYNIDTTRIYMTGLSMGGNGCWRYAIDYPHVLAAMVPICGQTFENETKNDLKKDACRIKNIPVNVFHGARDEMINVHHSIDMVEALNSCKPAPRVAPKLTVYDNTGHDSWTRTYSNIDGPGNVYDWLLQYKNPSFSLKSASASAVNPAVLSDGRVELRKVAKLPLALKECSGIVMVNRNKMWAHNDGGNAPVLFAVDSLGKILETKRVVGAANVDWEDICRDEKYFYIGDFGNNANKRKGLQIYRILNPDSVKDDRVKSETIEFSYADQVFPTSENKMNYDVEAMVNFNDSLFLFTKNRTKPFNGYVYVYKLPAKPGKYQLSKTDSLFLGKSNAFEYMITSAAISPNKKNLVLLSYNKLWIFSCFEGSNFFKGTKNVVDLNSFSQKEAVSFVNDEEVYITDEEALPISIGQIYGLKINKFYCQ